MQNLLSESTRETLPNAKIQMASKQKGYATSSVKQIKKYLKKTIHGLGVRKE